MERRELTMLRPQELRSRAKDSSSSWGQYLRGSDRFYVGPTIINHTHNQYQNLIKRNYSMKWEILAMEAPCGQNWHHERSWSCRWRNTHSCDWSSKELTLNQSTVVKAGRLLMGWKGGSASPWPRFPSWCSAWRPQTWACLCHRSWRCSWWPL